MSQYEEYKPKKPRNLTFIVLGAFIALLIIILAVAYAMLATKDEGEGVEYPTKIIMPAGGDLSSFQMEENVISDVFVVGEGEVDDIEDMLFGEYQEQPEEIEEVAALPEKEKPAPTPSKEHYKPSFVATPDSPQWMTNAVTTKINPNKPMVAIVIDDLGIDKRRTQKTIDLPAPLNLAFLPYPSNLPQQTATAKAAGHELIVHMPMEPSNLAENNPGPKALLTKNGNAVNLKNLKNNLDQFEGYVGVNNHMGSRFTSDYDAMGPVLEELKRRGLLFLDSRTIGSSKAKKLAGELDLPFVSRDVFLDHDPSRAGVDASLAQTARVALKKGTAIAIGHPKDHTIAALQAWIPKAKAQGIQIVPLTAIAHKRMGIDQPSVVAKTPEPVADEKAETKDTTTDELNISDIAKAFEKEKLDAVTVTVGGEKSYDAIIWNESPEPETY